MFIEQIQFIKISNFFRRPSEKMFTGEVSKKPQFEAFKKFGVLNQDLGKEWLGGQEIKKFYLKYGQLGYALKNF